MAARQVFVPLAAGPSLIMLRALINIGVVSGSLPLLASLPFIKAYGGSNP